MLFEVVGILFVIFFLSFVSVFISNIKWIKESMIKIFKLEKMEGKIEKRRKIKVEKRLIRDDEKLNKRLEIATNHPFLDFFYSFF